jgi:hypothetical protein
VLSIYPERGLALNHERVLDAAMHDLPGSALMTRIEAACGTCVERFCSMNEYEQQIHFCSYRASGRWGHLGVDSALPSIVLIKHIAPALGQLQCRLRYIKAAPVDFPFRIYPILR